MTLCARSMKLLRERGYLVSRCEHWNPYARKTFDLFGIFDLVAMSDCSHSGPLRAIIGVQVTSASNASSHRKKIRASHAAKKWDDNGGAILLLLWAKKKNRWQVTEEWL